MAFLPRNNVGLTTLDYIRITFYLLVLIGLISVYIKAGGDPCNRCSLRIDSLNETLTCRDLINRTITPFIKEPVGNLLNKEQRLNLSQYTFKQ